MDDLLSEFLTETTESIATLDLELVQFEQDPNNKTILSNIFRLVHTIKGTCGFLGLPRLETLAHAGENVLSKIRDGILPVTPEVVSIIFECLDKIKEILNHLEQQEVEPDIDNSDLISRLNAVANGEVVASETAEVKQVEAEVTPEKEANKEVNSDDDSFPVAAELLAEVEEAYAQGKKAATIEEINAELASERNNSTDNTTSSNTSEVAVPAVSEPKVKETKEKATKEISVSEHSISNQSIRVSVELLEDLMNQVSELVLVRNQLLQRSRLMVSEGDLSTSLQRLSLITTDLQEGIMKTRMQPIGNAWSKLPRIIRDLSIETGKKLDLVMLGAETELDRQVLEQIKDPLTHMVRNSADHGIESSEERKTLGKPEAGTITLNAFHEGGHIIIEVKDDGRGLNIEKIKEKIIMNSLATEAELENMSEQQIALFIFNAGFSTAEKITSVSGRGVGMDVVRTNIEKIGGTIEINTIAGKGSTFIIKIPLTLAIVSALIVSSGKEKFAIPQISVLELVRISPSSEQQIESINNSLVLRLRDRLLPLVSLSSLLELSETEAEIDADTEKETLASSSKSLDEAFIVVSQVGAYTFGILVDRVYDTEEIVVKPVSPILRNITIFSGNTILGDGSVIMILDPNGIATFSGKISTDISQTVAVEEEALTEKTSILIFRPSKEEIMAVPLALVARLEDIDVSSIEYSYGKPVVQYRGHLMPLLSITDNIVIPESGSQPVLVFSDKEKSMGLLVEEIIDIIDDVIQVEIQSNRIGVIGSAIIKNKATDIIDIAYYLDQAFGDWFKNLESGEKHSDINLLFVDDSAFFRNLLSPILNSHGYNVITASSGAEALELRARGLKFDIIVSDIEMPEMSGIDLAKQIKQEGIWQNTPLIALSSSNNASDIERGKEVGFDDYIAKFDRDGLLKVLADCINNTKEAKMLSYK